MTILYFTATGNSLAVARSLGGELLSIPKLVKEGRYEIEDDVIGVICPTYCADAPRMVREYLSKASIKADYTCIVGVFYGTRSQLSSHYKKIDEDYPVIVGQDFWYHLTGDPEFYDDLISAFAEVADEMDSSALLQRTIDRLAFYLDQISKE